MSKIKFHHQQQPEYLPPAKVRSLFLTSTEIGLTDYRLDELEVKFNATCDGLSQLETRFECARTARGDIPESAANGLIWQRNRAFLVAIVQLKTSLAQVRNRLYDLKLADAAVRKVLEPEKNWGTLVSNNLRCAYEIYEAAAALSIESALFLAENETTARTNGAAGIEHLRHTPPGFNRNCVLKLASLDGGEIKYTVGGELYDSPPDNPRLAGEIDRAITAVGAREFRDRDGWVATYFPDRDHTGPKVIFRKGVRL